MNRDIVVIGASAGGVECLTEIVRGLPADFPAAVFVVLHISPHSMSVLPQILERSGHLPAIHPTDGDPIQRGRIYIAPPDHHLLIEGSCVRVLRGPRENGHRPAVDPLFRTAARYYGPRVIGVVVSGALDDGTAGLMAVKARSGLALVQNPREALHHGMPDSAVQNVEVDQILSLKEIAPALVELVAETVEVQSSPVTEAMKMETDIMGTDMGLVDHDERPGVPSSYTCPECHGALYELADGKMVRYRCRVGHAFSPDSLLAEQAQSLEAALWIALRALEESSSLARRVADRAKANHQGMPASRFEERAAEADLHAAAIRDVLLGNRNIAAPLGDLHGEANGSVDGNSSGESRQNIEIEPTNSGNS
ncbi:MAG TPA: chemotaxis protein CheB [Abditibacteriaceae bacterium]|jgi:two-component system chemotaxis response regulator CheB